MTTLPRRSPLTGLRELTDRAALGSIDQQIGQELRALYNEVLAEPIPDRLLALIAKLDESETQTPDGEAEITS